MMKCPKCGCDMMEDMEEGYEEESEMEGGDEGEEGCLSLPELYATVPRAAQIIVDAFDLDGQPFEIELEDFPARVVQHEYDHLEGLMFTDRISPAELNRLQLQIADLEQQFAARQKEGQIATLELLNAELDELERART